MKRESSPGLVVSASLPEPEFTPTAFGRYTLIAPLAVGGMAEIFRARQDGPAGFSRELVIKRILPALAADGQFVQMFLDEARLVAQLAHPNIVPVFDFGEVGGAYFMALELVHGPSLRGVLKAIEQLDDQVPLRVAAKIVAGVAEGLHYAHYFSDSAGRPLQIVHRDISTSNILVSSAGVPRILDFGIARAVTQSHKTATGVVKGKLRYMPPEQIRGEALDGRADIYSLGVVLYRLLTRVMPYTGESDFDLMNAICRGGCALPSQVRAEVPPALDRVLSRALAPQRAERFATARELCAELEQYCTDHGGSSTNFEVAEFLVALARRTPVSLESLGVPGGSRPSDRVDIRCAPPTAPTIELSQITAASGPSRAGSALSIEASPSTPSRAADAIAPRGRGRFTLIVAALILLLGGGAGAAWWLTQGRAEPTTPGAGTDLLQPSMTGSASGSLPASIPARPLAASPAAAATPSPPAAVPADSPTPIRTPERTTPPVHARHGKRAPAKKGRAMTPAPPESVSAAEPRPPQAPPPPPADPAKLVLVVKPWGRIYVDGELRGETPMPPIVLGHGIHRIRAVHPDTAYAAEEEVDLRPGETRTLRFDLTAVRD